jgi:hypothetical protein
MTDEQIKQNAEEYAGNSAKHLQQPYEEYKLRYDAYLAGVHSRDDEIKELKKKVSALETIITTARATISTQEEIIKDLNNPWISVEDGLPERHTPVYAKNNNKAWFFALMTDNRQRPWYNIVGRCGEKVTHWKPIYKLKKGE